MIPTWLYGSVYSITKKFTVTSCSSLGEPRETIVVTSLPYTSLQKSTNVEGSGSCVNKLPLVLWNVCDKEKRDSVHADNGWNKTQELYTQTFIKMLTLHLRRLSSDAILLVSHSLAWRQRWCTGFCLAHALSGRQGDPQLEQNGNADFSKCLS